VTHEDVGVVSSRLRLILINDAILPYVVGFYSLDVRVNDDSQTPVGSCNFVIHLCKLMLGKVLWVEDEILVAALL
jgi:hypothetical protein